MRGSMLLYSFDTSLPFRGGTSSNDANGDLLLFNMSITLVINYSLDGMIVCYFFDGMPVDVISLYLR